MIFLHFLQLFLLFFRATRYCVLRNFWAQNKQILKNIFWARKKNAEKLGVRSFIPATRQGRVVRSEPLKQKERMALCHPLLSLTILPDLRLKCSRYDEISPTAAPSFRFRIWCRWCGESLAALPSTSESRPCFFVLPLAARQIRHIFTSFMLWLYCTTL